MNSAVSWWYLSFADDDDSAPHGGFLGAALVVASSFEQAVDKVYALGIAPLRGEVRGHYLPNGIGIPAEAANRLLSYEELERIFGELDEWSEPA